MEIIKRKILLEEAIDRNYNSPSYGLITADTFYVNVMLTQNIDDMGLYTDSYFLPNFPENNTPVNYSVLINKLVSSGITFPFMQKILPVSSITSGYDIRITGKTDSNYYSISNLFISATTESRLPDVQSYDQTQRYKVGFDMENAVYVNFSGQSIDGVSRVTSVNPQDFRYAIDADKTDPLIGQIGQKNGFLFLNALDTQNVINYNGEGWNQTNTSVSALTKEEYLLGIISKPEIESDVFIDRGISVVLERHLKLSEITNLDQLLRYGRGYYTLNLQ